ncbi:sugar O-acetyltransferase [Segetibacter sp. 3557_3]|uniref:sugar O-acetyltransferase n=1 Tax=Segetibacter sp. 3557_3 TaxID=2547429 RepID=UPI0010583CEA|nr:sugar O-acetyltransferase [Segetibacter sp. 3557_3]TDH21477.1 sugar O-acetyltransferase [Segetibacter sp. 3557_3]
MSAEKEKMLAGELYNAGDPQLITERLNCRLLIKKLNDSSPEEMSSRGTILRSLIWNQGDNLWIEPPFYCDYGYNIKVGDRVFFNFNCVLLDVMQITIGNDVLFGPGVQVYTAMHPMNWQERASGVEFAKPITIGSNVWIGGGAVICPGVSIGDRSIIGAGSVVTKDVPADVVAAGNPCKTIRSLT